METNQAILHDGYLIDPDTGEVLGLVEIEERIAASRPGTFLTHCVL